MRCKVGDLVLCVGPPHDQGGPFSFSKFLGFSPRGLVGEVVGPALMEDHDWSVRVPNHPCPIGNGTWAAKDSELRPLRDNDGEDEMLRIAGRPAESVREALEGIRKELME